MRISRKWLIYGLAWTPFLLTVFFIMRASGAYSTTASARNALAMTLIAALAGAAVAWWAQRKVEQTRKPVFFIGHRFEEVGVLKKVGYKFGSHIDVSLWQRSTIHANHRNE